MFNITNLILEDKLLEFLRFANNNFVISQILTQGSIGVHLKDEGNYISTVEGEYDTISYLPKSKMDKEEDVWNKSRVKIKIGRFIKKFFTEFSLKEFKIDDSAIEKFVNVYKSYFSEDGKNLKVVEGLDIQKYYLEDNYYREGGYINGTLWNSCMRQRERNKFMKLYTVNPNIKMLTLFDETGEKVKARAILWESGVLDEEGREWKVMDRVYSFFDHQVDIFKKWANENGYIYKWRQDAKSELYFIVDDKKKRLNLSIKLEKSNFETYPYLDTFKFYNVKEGRFSNNDRCEFDYILTSSRGYLPEDVDESDDDLTFTFDDNAFNWDETPRDNSEETREVPRPLRVSERLRRNRDISNESNEIRLDDISGSLREILNRIEIRRSVRNDDNNTQSEPF